MPSSAGCTSCPARNTSCPAFRSSPAKRRFCPAFATAPARDAHAAAVFARALLHDDGVGALRHHAAGEDAHALARRRRAPPHGLPANDSPTRVERRLAVRREVGEAHRVAVHRRVVVAGHGERRDDVGGEHAAERAARMCTRSVAVDRGEERADQLARACRPASSSDRSRRRRRLRAGSSVVHRADRVVSIRDALRLGVAAAQLVGGVDVAERVGLVVERDLDDARASRTRRRSCVRRLRERRRDAAARRGARGEHRMRLVEGLRDRELRVRRARAPRRAARRDRRAGTANRRAR